MKRTPLRPWIAHLRAMAFLARIPSKQLRQSGRLSAESGSQCAEPGHQRNPIASAIRLPSQSGRKRVESGCRRAESCHQRNLVAIAIRSSACRIWLSVRRTRSSAQSGRLHNPVVSVQECGRCSAESGRQRAESRYRQASTATSRAFRLYCIQAYS